MKFNLKNMTTGNVITITAVNETTLSIGEIVTINGFRYQVI